MKLDYLTNILESLIKNEEYLFAKKRIVVSTQQTSGSGYGMTKHRKDPSINVIQRLKL